MNYKISRILGLAFLLQVITSYSSGLFFRPLWFIADDIGATMSKITENPNLFSAHILVNSLTALGVVFSGAVLFDTLKNQHKKLALTGLGFYILDGHCWLAAESRVFRSDPLDPGVVQERDGASRLWSQTSVGHPAAI